MTARRRRLGVIMGVCAALGLGFAALADAGRVGSGHSRPRISLTPPRGPVGVSVQVRGWGFRPHLPGVVLFGRRPVAVFRAGDGRFRVAFNVPGGKLGMVVVSTVSRDRGRHDSVGSLPLASARFRVLARRLAPGSGGSGSSGGGPAGGATSRWRPPQHLTWYWQLQGSIREGVAAAAYDIDGFGNSAAEVSRLRAQGKHVICYVNVGTYEPDRPDSGQFTSSVLGNGVEGWPGERWLDIRRLSLLEPVMAARFAMCQRKGFDAVEPDNMDGYANSTGFSITAQQQLAYNEWVAREVHSLGMAVFQKNDGEQSVQLEPEFDGALDEQCNQYSECGDFRVYVAAGKPVLNAEYALSTNQFCAADDEAGIMGARYNVALDGTKFEPCR